MVGKNMAYKTNRGLKIDGKIIEPLGGDMRDDKDHRSLRQSANRHNGFNVGQYLQPAPIIFNRWGHNIWLGDMYRGHSAFLISPGPSFSDIDHDLLRQPGVLTMGINNVIRSFRTDLWVSVDDPTHFIKSTWLDPTIMKFVPFCHAEKNIWDNEAWEESRIKTGDCPNVWYYRRNEHFITQQFLFEDTVNWGNHKDYGGGRSVFMAAIRILFYLGIRRIFLLGCDFSMDTNNKYCFDQDRTDNSISNNNKAYELMTERFNLLKPVFIRNNFFIYNCNPNSNLHVFPYVELNDAISMSTEMFGDVENERTSGLYERKSKE